MTRAARGRVSFSLLGFGINQGISLFFTSSKEPKNFVVAACPFTSLSWVGKKVAGQTFLFLRSIFYLPRSFAEMMMANGDL
jgi:hypothetical protein